MFGAMENPPGGVMNLAERSVRPCLRLLSFLLVPLLAGCMHPMHTLDQGVELARDLRLLQNHDLNRPRHYTLSPNSSLYVAQTLPAIRVEDADYERIATASYRAFAPRFAAVWRGERTESLRLALESARDHQADFVVYPSLVVWDDDVGNWAELKDWWQARDTRVQDPLPTAAEQTAQVRARQQEERARAEAELRRDDYYRWQEAQTQSQVELWKVRGRMAEEKLSRMQVKMLKSGEEFAQWTHEQARAFVLWLRSREYDSLGRDQVALRVVIADARTGELVESSLLEAQSGWLTLIGDRPDTVMESALTAYAQSLSPVSGSSVAARNRFQYW